MQQLIYYIAPASILIFTIAALSLKTHIFKQFILIFFIILSSTFVHSILLEPHIFDTKHYISSLLQFTAIFTSLSVSPVVSAIAFHANKKAKYLFAILGGTIALLFYKYTGVVFMCYIGQNCL